jgi:hypothetical protein
VARDPDSEDLFHLNPKKRKWCILHIKIQISW